MDDRNATAHRPGPDASSTAHGPCCFGPSTVGGKRGSSVLSGPQIIRTPAVSYIRVLLRQVEDRAQTPVEEF